MNKYGTLEGVCDRNELILMAKYVYSLKYLNEKEKLLFTFLINYIILKMINNIYDKEHLDINKKISELKNEIKHNNKRQVKNPKYTNDNNVYTLGQIKKCGLYNQELKKEKLKNDKFIGENFKLLLIENDKNFGILKLAYMLKDVTVLDFRNVQNEEFNKACNELHLYIKYPFCNDFRSRAFIIQNGLTKEQWKILCPKIANYREER
jgi:hypothetical protein